MEIKYQPDFYNVIDHDFKGDYQKFVDYLYKKSKLMKSDKKIYINKKSYHKDPGVVYGESVKSAQADIVLDLEAVSDSIDILERYLCAAKLRMEEDMPNYSDANFTMRLSYGQVGEYLIRPQVNCTSASCQTMISQVVTLVLRCSMARASSLVWPSMATGIH